MIPEKIIRKTKNYEYSPKAIRSFYRLTFLGGFIISLVASSLLFTFGSLSIAPAVFHQPFLNYFAWIFGIIFLFDIIFVPLTVKVYKKYIMALSRRWKVTPTYVVKFTSERGMNLSKTYDRVSYDEFQAAFQKEADCEEETSKWLEEFGSKPKSNFQLRLEKLARDRKNLEEQEILITELRSHTS